MTNLFKLFYVTAAVLLTAYISSVFTFSGINSWYQTFPKPAFVPPDKFFSIAWSLIYALLIAASFIALVKADSMHKNRVNNLFLMQLVLQIAWCYSFFAVGWLGLGLLIIILLDIVVYKMISVYQAVHKWSSWLLYPYYWWLIFATFLNATYVAEGGLIVTF